MCAGTVSSYTSVQCNITRTQSGMQTMLEEVPQPRAIGLMISVETFRTSEGSVPKRRLPELSLLGVESILVLVMRTVTSRGAPPSSYFPTNTLASHSATISTLYSFYRFPLHFTNYRYNVSMYKTFRPFDA